MRTELSEDYIEKLLHDQIVGRIGCHADGITYVVPVTYTYDGANFYIHSANGMKIDMMRKNPEVCFQVDDIDNLAQWQSVVAWGRFEELHNQDRERAMGLLVDRMMALLTAENGMPAQGAIKHAEAATHEDAVWYRININKKTGRIERH